MAKPLLQAMHLYFRWVMFGVRAGRSHRGAPMTDDELDAEARATAHQLIQGYLGPDHKVVSMSNFYDGLVQALKDHRRRGRDDMRDDMVGQPESGRTAP